jgi:hypothetical protein
MIRLKKGVSLDNCHPRVFLIIGFAAPIWDKYGSKDLTVTAANEEGHSKGPRGASPNSRPATGRSRNWPASLAPSTT